MLNFAANLSMLFGDKPFLSRFSAAAAAGFSGVEFLFPYDWRAEVLRAALGDNDLRQVLFNLPPGDWDAGERGLACHPGRELEFRDGLARALAYAKALKTPRLHAMAGLKPEGLGADELLETYRANIAFAARRCADQEVCLLIEPINPHDMPGYFLDDFGMAAALIEAIASRQSAAPKLQFDLYHCARIHGAVAPWIERTAHLIGHYQIAAPISRQEPDGPAADWGDESYLDLLAAAQAATPNLWVGCEYRPAGETRAGLGWLAQARARLQAQRSTHLPTGELPI